MKKNNFNIYETWYGRRFNGAVRNMRRQIEAEEDRKIMELLDAEVMGLKKDESKDGDV